MNKRIDFSNLGGYPLAQEDLEWLQSSYSNTFGAIAALIGNMTIINGMIPMGGGNISNGWVSINNELLPFIGGALGSGDFIIEETANALTFNDGVSRNVLFNKVARLSVGGAYNYSQLIRLSSLKDIYLPGDIKELACDADYITANFDNTGLGINLRQGWAICNGNNGTINKKGRVSVMLDTDQTEFDTIGKPGGAKTHSLTEPQLPVITPQIRGGQNGSASGGSWDNAPIDWSETGNPHGYIVNGKPFGGNQPHNNLQPYIVTLFIQKL